MNPQIVLHLAALAATILSMCMPAAPADSNEPPASSAPPSAPVSSPAITRSADRRAAGYHLEAGPYEVGVVDKLVLHDAKRTKDLELTIRYPKVKADESTTLPFIVFSHGMGGNRAAFADLSAHWASHGYIVVHPTHSDSIALKREAGERTPGRDMLRKGTATVDAPDRLADVKFLLDSIGELEEKVPGLKDSKGSGRIDRDRCAIAGHSAGAYTTQIAFGVKVRGVRFGSLDFKNYGDERFKAAILISGQGLFNATLSKDSWSEISRPMLVMTGSLDTTTVSDETPASRRHPYEYAKPGDKYLVFIEGATHGSYSGKNSARLLGESPTTDIAIITDTVASSTLAFWDRYLRNDSSAGAYLAGEGLKVLSAGKAELSRK